MTEKRSIAVMVRFMAIHLVEILGFEREPRRNREGFEKDLEMRLYSMEI